MSSCNLPATKFIKQSQSRTKLFITQEDDLDLHDLHFHSHWQMMTDTKHSPTYRQSSAGNTDIHFYPHLILQKETKISRVLLHNVSFFCSAPHWKSCYMTAQSIWKINKKQTGQLNQPAQNLGLMAFIFVTPFQRSYWCFSLTHLSLSCHAAMESWANLAATRRASSPRTRTLHDSGLQERQESNILPARCLSHSTTEF